MLCAGERLASLYNQIWILAAQPEISQSFKSNLYQLLSHQIEKSYMSINPEKWIALLDIKDGALWSEKALNCLIKLVTFRLGQKQAASILQNLCSGGSSENEVKFNRMTQTSLNSSGAFSRQKSIKIISRGHGDIFGVIENLGFAQHVVRVSRD